MWDLVTSLQVTVGQVNWLAPTGVTGLHPIASLGPVTVGPGVTEGSWAHLPEVRVSLNPIQSLVQRKVVLKLNAPGAEVLHHIHAWFLVPNTLGLAIVIFFLFPVFRIPCSQGRCM